MIKGYRFVSGSSVSAIYRTAQKAMQEAGKSALPYPLVIVRETADWCLTDAFACDGPGAEWVNLRKGLLRGAVTAGDVQHVEYADRMFFSRPFAVPCVVWGETFTQYFATRPTRRMMRLGMKDLKAWYLSFHGDPICEGE